MAGGRQLETELRALLGEKRVRDLDENAGTVSGDGSAPDGAAMLEVLEDRSASSMIPALP